MALSTVLMAKLTTTVLGNKKLRNTTVIILVALILIIVFLPLLIAGGFMAAILAILNSLNNEEDNAHYRAMREVRAEYSIENSLSVYTLKAVDLFYNHSFMLLEWQVKDFLVEFFVVKYEEVVWEDTDGDGEDDEKTVIIKYRYKYPDEIMTMLRLPPFSFDDITMTAISKLIFAPPGLDEVYDNIDNETEFVGGAFGWPLPGYTSLSSYYGTRFGGSDFHTGIDVPAPAGVSIRAANDGVVIRAQSSYTPGVSYGKHVIVDHGGGFTTIYAHMSSVLVSVGERVVRGETELGKVGSTGWSTGNHLHFEIRVNGKHQNPLDMLK